MCPLGLVRRLFPISSEGLRPALQVQRVVTQSRVPELVRYITGHPKSYILSSLTASINMDVRFDKAPGSEGAAILGNLRIPMDAQLLLHDGLHRRLAIEKAIEQRPEMADETISLVLFVDPGLRRSEQMFTDLKRNETHSARSRSILCDHRDETARLVKAVVARIPVFSELTEMSRSTISNRSAKLFTFSGIYHATVLLLSGKQGQGFGNRLALATDFWSEVAKQVPDWERARMHEVSTAELRKTCVHAHAIALAGLARAGKTLLEKFPDSWRQKLAPLAAIDWSRANTHLWEGRAMIAGRLSKARVCVVLTGNVIKRQLKLSLGPDEAGLEKQAKGR
jgi:DNA sulfur modification protein DndB